MQRIAMLFVDSEFRVQAQADRRREENVCREVVQNRPGCYPAEGPRFLDQQEIPALLSHRVPPVDTLFVAFCEGVVIDAPHVFQEFFNSSK